MFIAFNHIGDNRSHDLSKAHLKSAAAARSNTTPLLWSCTLPSNTEHSFHSLHLSAHGALERYLKMKAQRNIVDTNGNGDFHSRFGPKRIAVQTHLFLETGLKKFVHCNFLAKAQNTTIPVNVGVILDFDAWSGKMGLSCINMALADFYASNSNYKTRLVLNSRDSKSDVVGAAAAVFSSYRIGTLRSCSNGLMGYIK
ncbi:glutamate receptor 2.8-like [Fagus crenata]